MRSIFCIICNGQPYAQLYIGVRIKKGNITFNPAIYWLCESHFNDHTVTTIDALVIAKAFGVKASYQLLSPCCRRPTVYVNVSLEPSPLSPTPSPQVSEKDYIKCRCGKVSPSKEAIAVSTVPTRKE